MEYAMVFSDPAHPEQNGNMSECIRDLKGQLVQKLQPID